MKIVGSIKFKKQILFVIRVLLGGIFIWASIDKILHPASFAVIIKDYQLLPSALINVFAVTLPWVELILGAMLVFGVWLHGAVLLATVLLVVFWGALVLNLARGLDVRCGCFSSDATGNPTIIWYLIRDSIFVFMAGYLFREATREAR